MHILNNRIDIALAIGADGVHVGQSDMPAPLARKLLPPGSILGVSTNTPAEASQAAQDGADYIGIGPIWNTTTKKDLKTLLGVRGVGPILGALEGTNVKAVGIGTSGRLDLSRFLFVDVRFGSWTG